jgi:hypothetical protein
MKTLQDSLGVGNIFCSHKISRRWALGDGAPLTASHIHSGCIQSVLAPWDAVDGHMGASIVVLHVQVGVIFWKNGEWMSLYDVVVSWLRLQTPIDCIPHPYWMYTTCMNTLRCCGWVCFTNPIHGVIPSTWLWNWWQGEYDIGNIQAGGTCTKVLIMDITTYLVKLYQSKGYTNYFKVCQLCAAFTPFSEQSMDNNGQGSR